MSIARRSAADVDRTEARIRAWSHLVSIDKRDLKHLVAQVPCGVSDVSAEYRA
jgi:hypothetical protein